MSRKGNVFFLDQKVASIEETDEGQYRFQYTVQEPVSLTLKWQNEPYESPFLFPFLDGLIPEGWLLGIATKNWKLDANDRLALLLTVCRDCIGAVSVLPEDEEPIKQTSSSDQPLFSEGNISYRTCLSTLNPLSVPALYEDRASRSLFGQPMQPVLNFDKEEIERLAESQIDRHIALTGVQRKISLTFPKDQKGRSRLTYMGQGGTHILKPPFDDYPEMPQVEHTTMKLAELAGFNVPPCGLIPLKNGELAFIIRRFDRDKGNKIPVEDLCQLSEKLTEHKYRASLEATSKIIRKFSSVPGDDLLTFFDLNLFCFITGNADMHLKNFSMWKDPESGLTRMSPVYDLLSTRLLISEKRDPEEAALPLNGKKANLKLSDFIAFSRRLEISDKVFQGLLEKYKGIQKDFESLIERSFLSDEKKSAFRELIQERLSRLF